MATVTGDVGIDFSGLDDANPFTDSLITSLGAGVRVTGGALKAIDTIGGFITSTDPVTGVITAKMELNAAHPSGDPIGPAILNSSGNGYWLRCNYAETRIYLVNSMALGARVGAATNGNASGLDELELSLDPETGELISYLNGVEIETVTDATYDTGMRAGLVSNFANNNDAGALSWAADGYSSTTATLDDENLTYGEPFTGTFANMDPVPTSLTISDGTRSATVAITTDAGTFAGTMPALPAAGAEQATGSQVYPGGVTMTIGGVEIETTLALEAGDDSIIVGASPVYTAYDDMGWTEAQRPATGDCLVWDDQAGEIEFFADLTVDVNVEVTDGYLCIIRADGAAEANAFRSTGVSEIGAVDPEPPGVVISRAVRPTVRRGVARSVRGIGSAIS